MKHQRLYTDGVLKHTDVDTPELVRRLQSSQGDGDTYAWIDLTTDSVDQLNELAEVLDLHDLAVEDALTARERQKVSRFGHHALVRVTSVKVDRSQRVAPTGLTAFVTDNAVVTVRDREFPFDDVAERLDSNKDLAGCGPWYVVWGVLDVAVDNVMNALDELNEVADELSQRLFDDQSGQVELQQSAFALRRNIAAVRRRTVPLREMTTSLTRRESAFDTPDLLQAYLGDVHDHAVHAAETADSLREFLATIFETNIALQSNRRDEIMKKVTSWAAIIAVPTFITSFYGQNLQIAGIDTVWGAWLSGALMLLASLVLWWQFKRRDWL